MKSWEMYKMTRSHNRGKIQIIAVLVTVITLTFIVFQFLLTSWSIWFESSEDSITELSYRSSKPVKREFKGEKIVHVDLKGAPPSVLYLKAFFSLIKKLGATGVLIEYEDMFPYKDDLENIRALNAYSRSDIDEILKSAESNGLIVIPLIQTFGHLEYVLKLKEYRFLREVDAYPQVLCPSHDEGFSVLQKMIDQILEAHPKSKYIHVGCDEVFYLGSCDRCKRLIWTKVWRPDHLFFSHVKRVAQYISRTYSKVRPIIWNDMLTIKTVHLIEEFKLADLVDIMVWSYKMDVSVDYPDDIIQLYGKFFKSMWIASSYKGSTGVDQMIVDARYHLTNHMSWMDLVSQWERKINFKGIALTGWQRYDHFSVLCELLPVSIPSLSLSLHYLNGPAEDVDQTIKEILDCDSSVPFGPPYSKHTDIPDCGFPGFRIYKAIIQYYVFITDLKLPPSNLISGWMSTYNIVNKFSSPSHVNSYFGHINLNQTRINLRTLEKNLRKALSTIYDKHTVNEWITVRVTGLRIWLDAVFYSRAALLEQKMWPRRPLLDNTDDIIQNSTNQICSSDKKSTCGLFFNLKSTESS